MTGKHWVASYIGRSWSPDFNCWALVRAVLLDRCGIEMPDLGVGDMQATTSVAQIKAAAASSNWRQVDPPAQEMDVLLCRDLYGKRHVGIVIEWRGQMQLLHNDGHMSTRGPVGSVHRQPLVDLHQLRDVELWRRFP